MGVNKIEHIKLLLRLTLLYGGPLVVIFAIHTTAVRKDKFAAVKTALAILGVILFWISLLTLRLLDLDLAMNWDGKIAVILGFVSLSLYLGKGFMQESGMLRIPSKKSLVLALFTGLFICALSFLLATPMTGTPFVEKLFFQLTLPGIDEEIVFRGFLLTILNRHFGKTFILGKTRFGWGLCLIGIPFALAHIITESQNSLTTLEMVGTCTYTYIGSTLLAYLKESSGSIWAASVGHNVANTLELLIVRGSG